MRETFERWCRALLTPVDAASLAVFRCAFGAMVAIDALRYLASGRIADTFIRPPLHFTYLYFDFVRPFPGAWMYAFFWFLFAVAVMVSIGLFYRLAAVLLFLSYSYFFLLEQSIYMNHYYLIALLAFLLIWIPADRMWSMDARWRDLGPPVAPFAAVFILRFQLLVMYSYGAIAKLNVDWLRGEPMYSVIAAKGPLVPEIAHSFPPWLLAYGIAYGGIVADALIPILLAFRRTVIFGFIYACVFHILNAIFLNIGIFSYLAMAAITIFFPPDWPRRWIKKGSGIADTGTVTPHATTGTRALLVGMHLYIAFQLLFPFRHLAFPGVVGWTEEGHRFAWHMKLRKKHSLVAIRAEDPATGRHWTIDPRDDLNARQLRKLGTFPDIVLQYVHHKRDQLRAEGINDPVIKVDWFCSLNGRPYQRLIDPNVDLTKVERSWRHSPWILPLSDDSEIHATPDELADTSLIKVTAD